MGGFDSNYRSPVLDRLVQVTNSRPLIVQTEYLPNDRIRNNYPSLDIQFDIEQHLNVLGQFYQYRMHPEINFKNFVCSFNGTAHVSRKLLVAILYRMGWYNPEYSSKVFTFTNNELVGHIQDFVGDQERFYCKFFTDNNSDKFFNSTNEFNYRRFDHPTNIITLENKLTKSFVHLVSESMSTTYCPCIGEKFLYSVVTRGLFVCYAPLNCHKQLFDCHGFKAYDKIFDYRFDTVENPVERLMCLVEMLTKFEKLSQDDWMDLYRLETDAIEFNYDHYFSKNYIKCLERFV
jgi:hypothetical protein